MRWLSNRIRKNSQTDLNTKKRNDLTTVCVCACVNACVRASVDACVPVLFVHTSVVGGWMAVWGCLDSLGRFVCTPRVQQWNCLQGFACRCLRPLRGFNTNTDQVPLEHGTMELDPPPHEKKHQATTHPPSTTSTQGLVLSAAHVQNNTIVWWKDSG